MDSALFEAKLLRLFFLNARAAQLRFSTYVSIVCVSSKQLCIRWSVALYVWTSLRWPWFFLVRFLYQDKKWTKRF